MEQVSFADHCVILKRAGWALLIAGVLDICLMIYAILNQVSYSSSLNIFAAVAGIFLLRGSLRAASLVRWFSLFMLTVIVAMVVVWPIIQPMDLTLTLLQLAPMDFAGPVGIPALAMLLLVWLIHVLGSPPVLAARAMAGRPQRAVWIPLALGISLALIMAAVSFGVQHSNSAVRAIQEVSSRMGAEYRYHVSSLNIHSGPTGTVVSGVVVAWKNDTVKNVPFRWRE